MATNNVKPFELLVEYERLSLSHSVKEKESEKAKTGYSGVGFKIDNDQWVISIGKIEEVLILTDTTKIPGIASWVLGLGNIRGNLIPIVDFKSFLTGTPIKTTPHTRMIVINQIGGQVGLVVDEVFGQRHFEPEEEKGHDTSEESSKYIKNRYEDSNGVWNQLNVELLINDSAFQNAAAV